VDRLNDGNRFIVKEGLSVGDTIIAEGVGLMKEGMSITPKNEVK
jgi:membrane fusion protein (multidrug efflux system)